MRFMGIALSSLVLVREKGDSTRIRLILLSPVGLRSLARLAANSRDLPAPSGDHYHIPEWQQTPLRKIGPAIAKEGRAFSAWPASISSGGKMTKKSQDRSRRGGAESGRIWKARNFIDEHAGEELSLTRVAKAAETSANYLSEKFKEAVGINFVQYVARTRYEKAAALLGDADLRVSEIAFAAGFQSLSQFNRVFKKFSGKSPTEYRAATRGKRKQH
jgi:AraC-like DNA-binding protein